MTTLTATPHALRVPDLGELPWLLSGATVLSEIVNPLVGGSALNVLTVVTVVLFAAATATQVLVTRGRADALRLLVVSVGVGFVAEAVGVHTGVPFGHYSYSGLLGPRLLGVPVVIPLAWTMMAWPALCVGRRLGSPVLMGGVALASWDLFLDPQMVHDGYWSWRGPGPRLNGIPVVNQLGWLVVAVLLMAVLTRALPVPTRALPARETVGVGTAGRSGGSASSAPARQDALPLTLWLWTFASSILANVAFFGRPAVALAGGLAMALAGVPLIRTLRHR